MLIEKSAKDLTLPDIKKAEEKINLKFPNELKKFYLTYNGGFPENRFFYREEPFWGYIEIKVIYSIKYRLEDSNLPLLEDRYYDFKKRNVLPKHYLPFASDHGANQFCIDVRNDDIVIIYLDLGEVNSDSVNILINGFDNFINSLELTGDEEDV